MQKIVSYRQKLLELSKIYDVKDILENDAKLTTYDIEIILLKNKVPIPSRKSYINHKISNELVKPLVFYIKDIFFSIKDILSGKFDFLKKISKVPRNIKFFFINIVLVIRKFFSKVSNNIIDFLNDVYNFKVKATLFNKIFSRVGYISLIVTFVFAAYYAKQFTNNFNSVKFVLETKSDKPKKTKENKNIETKISKKPLEKKESKNKKVDIKTENTDTNEKNSYNIDVATILNLFEGLEYNLEEVRDEKRVKPIYFTKLPKDLDTIKSVKVKKNTFIQIVLPLIASENENIKKDRKYLLRIIDKERSDKENIWLKRKLKEYKVSGEDINELLNRIDIIPVSIALAQAAKESGWGTSRFALEGNAIFGQWTWGKRGIEPLEKTKNQTHKILKFPILRASIKAYVTNLNTHKSYNSFRFKRNEIRASNKQLKGLDLIHELNNYAQTGKVYTETLEKIIKQNSLDDFENIVVQDNKDKNQLNL